jgi:hypothetical protein
VTTAVRARHQHGAGSLPQHRRRHAAEEHSGQAAAAVAPDRHEGRRLALEHLEERRHRVALDDPRLAERHVPEVLGGGVARLVRLTAKVGGETPRRRPCPQRHLRLAHRHRHEARGVRPKHDRLV